MKTKTLRQVVSTAIALLLTMMAHGARAQDKVTGASPASTQITPPPVVLYGAVRSPGLFELRRKVRLVELIALAGGVTRQAGKTVSVIHTKADLNCPKPAAGEQEAKPIQEYKLANVLRGDNKANPYICAGDVVIVVEAEPVFVVGNVKRPQPVAFHEGVSIMEVIELAGGVSEDGERVRIRVARASGCELQPAFEVDLRAMRNRRVKDMPLQGYNLVEVSDREGTFHVDLHSFILCIDRVSPYPIFDSRPLIPRGYRVIH